MRKFKFRIWHITSKKMYFADHGEIMRVGDEFEWSPWVFVIKNDRTEDYILMQYTGLQDKKGKEIYEGDIIKYQDVDRNGDYYVKICPVEWDENNAGFDPLDRYGIIARECEVIGNIYENPQEAK